MSGKIAFALCEHYLQEARATLALEKLDDAVLLTFPAHCGRPPLTQDTLTAMVGEAGDIERLEIFGASCLMNLTGGSVNGVEIQIHRMEQCFCLAADPGIVYGFLKKGAYLTTPGWLARWPVHLEKMGFHQAQAREMFAETTSGIVLLDTGVDKESAVRLTAFAEYVDRPFEILCTGLTALRLPFVRSYFSWQVEKQKKKFSAQIRDLRQQAATHAMSIDLISKLARIVTESEAVESMLDVYELLFAPQRLSYLSYEDGSPGKLWTRPELPPDDPEREAIQKALAAFSDESGPTRSGRGFILRIVRRGEVRGVIAVEDIAFSEYIHQYWNMALSIVDICELPIENARKYEKLVQTEEMLRKANEDLYQLSTTDALTGIANRRAYDGYVEMEWKRMLRNKTPLSLIICDIDFFKKYNDHYGHKSGDVCLHTVAQIIRQLALRPGDFVARYGGEEFVVVLPDTPAEGALHIAEKIRMSVAQYNIPHEDSEIAPCVTLSLGVVEVQPPQSAQMTSALMFRVADAALYVAKNQGRNRSVVKIVQAHTA